MPGDGVAELQEWMWTLSTRGGGEAACTGGARCGTHAVGMPLAVANAWAFSKLLLATALHVALAASAIETTFFLAIEPGPKIPHLTVVASGDAADAMLLQDVGCATVENRRGATLQLAPQPTAPVSRAQVA